MYDNHLLHLNDCNVWHLTVNKALLDIFFSWTVILSLLKVTTLKDQWGFYQCSILIFFKYCLEPYVHFMFVFNFLYCIVSTWSSFKSSENISIIIEEMQVWYIRSVSNMKACLCPRLLFYNYMNLLANFLIHF